MSRRLVFATLLCGAVAACTVQPTPREYIDRQAPVEDVRAEARAVLHDRITLLVRALQDGDSDAARSALTPAEGVMVVGPGADERLVGATQLAAVLDLLAAGNHAALELVDLQVQVGPRASAAWFLARIEVTRPGFEEPVPLRVTGVLISREAEWELQQAHLAIPSTGFTAPPPTPPAAASSPAADG